MLAIHPSFPQIKGLLLVSVHHSERSSCASFRRLPLSCYLCGMRTLLIPLVLLLMLVGCGYVGRRMWLLLPMDNAYKMVILGLLIASLLCFFFNFIVGLDRFSLPVARVFYEVGNSSIFILLYLAMLFLALDIARLMGLVPPSFLRHSVQGTLFVSVAIVGLFGYGYLHYYHKVRVPIALSSHKPLPQPSKFVMISDMHLGYHNTRNDLAKWVDLINAEHPDAVLIAGDITDFSIQPLLKADMAAEFRRLNAPIYACLGNHDYYAGEENSERFYREAGIHLLRDTAVVIGKGIALVGRDDRTNTHRKTLNDIMKTIDGTPYTILLDHQPYHLEAAERQHIDFQFSGHTHNGQVWPINWIERALYEKAYGAHTRGKTHYYVSSGIGIWGGKFRIGTQSEYCVVTIQ